LVGTTSLGLFKASDNGGAAFAQIVSHYMGNFGTALTGVIVTLAVFRQQWGCLYHLRKTCTVYFQK
jgi:LIVCS family branched-chain amino acid:cation transporter